MNNEYLGSFKNPVRWFVETHIYPMRNGILQIVIKQKEQQK
jgi:hypothetical protein